MKITFRFIIPFILLLTFVRFTSAQESKGFWKSGINTKLTMRSGEMEFTTDEKGLKAFSLATSYYFYDTQNYHECDIGFSRNDGISKWTKKGNVTKIIDEDENETILTKTPGGFIIDSGCHNTQFYKVAFTLRGNHYVGREIK